MVLPGSWRNRGEKCGCKQWHLQMSRSAAAGIVSRAGVRAALLYEDAHIAVLNKWSGLQVQGRGGAVAASFQDTLRQALSGAPARPRALHRLDTGTTGCLLLAKTDEAAAALGAAVAGHHLLREYLAVSVCPDSRYSLAAEPRLRGDLVGWIAYEPLDNNPLKDRAVLLDAPRGDAVFARTQYSIVDSSAWGSLIRLRPLSGRRHQLRVQCADDLGLPVLGDALYGPRAPARVRERILAQQKLDLASPVGLKLHLHAARLVVPGYFDLLPGIGARATGDSNLEIVAPLPFYFPSTLRALSLAVPPDLLEIPTESPGATSPNQHHHHPQQHQQQMRQQSHRNRDNHQTSQRRRGEPQKHRKHRKQQ
eukprot:m.177986 g.177986  ORF g.177986 m.177986 type:complete len:365 (+) comp10444_c1_seq6:1909-3003(+)